MYIHRVAAFICWMMVFSGNSLMSEIHIHKTQIKRYVIAQAHSASYLKKNARKIQSIRLISENGDLLCSMSPEEVDKIKKHLLGSDISDGYSMTPAERSVFLQFSFNNGVNLYAQYIFIPVLRVGNSFRSEDYRYGYTKAKELSFDDDGLLSFWIGECLGPRKGQDGINAPPLLGLDKFRTKGGTTTAP